MTHIEALKLALEALETADETDFWNKQKQAITALKEALAQPAQEPVAFLVDGDLYYPEEVDWEDLEGHGVELLYTIPPQRPLVLQREWVDLTNEEIDKWAHELHGVIYAVMADLKEKNT